MVAGEGRQNGREKDAMAEFPLGTPPFVSSEMPFNPFKNNSVPMDGAGEMLKMVLMTPIFLLRVVLLLLCFLVGYITAKVAMLGAKDVLTKPFPQWRRNLLLPVRLCARGVLLVCGYNWIKVKGKQAPRDVAPILVSNHCSFIDPVFLFFAHLPMFVTAKENLKIPIAGEIMLAIQAIPVDRASPTSRKDAAGEIKRRSICNDWNRVALFPEATTTNGRALVSFKAGAFTPGVPIQPVIVRYPHVRCDPSWVVEGPPVHILLFRLMMQLHNHMEVEYLDVLEPTIKEQKNPHFFAERCRMTMARALNVTVTEHAFGDVALALESLKLKPPGPAGVANIEFGRMERLFKLNLKEAIGFLHKFEEMDVARRGLVTVEEFLIGLGLPDSSVTRRVFGLFDTSDRGHINFREYVAGLAFVSKHKRFKESVEVTFNFLDADKDGVLNAEDVKESLEMLFPTISEAQVQKLFEALNGSKSGAVTADDVSLFLQKHPEYLAAVLMARPSLLSSDNLTS